jgi:uncharacterized membrane protein (UPF0182 family)
MFEVPRLVPRSRKPRIVEGAPPFEPRDLIGLRVFLRYFGSSLLVLLAALVLYVPLLAAHVHVNIWWFESIRLGDVYGRMWSTQQYLFLLYGFLTYLFLSLVFFATRALTYRPGVDRDARAADLGITVVVGLVSAVVALTAAHSMADQWQTYLLAKHATGFGITDPLHHRDVGFYVFSMPWREVLAGFAGSILVLGGVGLASLASAYTLTSPYQTGAGDFRRIVTISSLFAAVLFGYLAWRNFFLSPYDLQQQGVAYGGGATFAHATLWWYSVVGAVEVIAALVLLANSVLGRVWLTSIAALPILVAILSGAGQGIFQRFVVSPNELSAEYQYLGYTLHSTRHAYGIDQWGAREYTPSSLTAGDISHDRSTITDARIADAGAFTQVMQQRQENRTYYTFNTADVDRYVLGGNVRQVLLAGRETDFGKLSAEAQTWVNEHLKFTHGYGLTMSPANTVTRDGQPVLWIQNVPVQETISGLPPVRQPRLYFGELTSSWIVTHATTSEFDSSTADRDTAYRYAGPDGIPVGSGLKRLTLSWVLEGGIPFFNRLNISGYIQPTSRVSLHRNIMERVQTLAPWLTLDSNPYLVLRANGSLVWIVDGMTHTDHYPYSDPTSGDNYRRNSVKVVVDAYTGVTTFYAFDAEDPILRAWSSAFPGMIHPLREMPSDIRAHIKYPDDYLSWQADAYQRYHVTDITSYYNGDNEWDIETSTSYDWQADQASNDTLSPIWTVARLFGEQHDSFYSILPFSVRGKAPMSGFLAADNNTYRVTALDMPRGAQTMGATQFESLYNQAPAISSSLTLLDQHGSQVIPGQLLILPVGKALLYIKPLYLRSASSQTLPQLIRVVVGTQNAVNWGYSLQNALQNLLTQGDISNVGPATAVKPPAPSTSPTAIPAAVSRKYSALTDAQLIALANTYYSAAQNTPSLTAKDRDLTQVGAILRVLMGRHGKT